MKEWVIQMGKFLLSNWRECLLGGTVVVSIVIFLVGCLKKVMGDKHKSLRKTILFISSLVLVAPFTLGNIYLNHWDFKFFWVMYLINCLYLITVYAGYENLHVREGLHWLGKNTILRLFDAVYVAFHNKDQKTENLVAQAVEKSLKDAEMLLKKHVYKDDDLKNL